MSPKISLKCFLNPVNMTGLKYSRKSAQNEAAEIHKKFNSRKQMETLKKISYSNCLIISSLFFSMKLFKYVLYILQLG